MFEKFKRITEVLVCSLLLTANCLLGASDGRTLGKNGGSIPPECAQMMKALSSGNLPGDFPIEALSAEQCRAIKAEVFKAGGELTPEAISRLRMSSEFKGLRPEEIIKGKKLLDQGTRTGERKKEGADLKAEEKAGEESLFDRYMSESSSLEISDSLKTFGYEIFKGVTLTPPQDVPVASDYILGPGDEVKVLLWGRVNADYALTVDRDGNILFPNIGPLSVAGMTFEEMKKIVTREAKNIVGAEVNVTMGRLRSIQVFVLGEVKKPGAYTLSAMSTLTNALMAAGGPTRIGTLRKVELKRSNKTISTMDFYDLLLKGDKSRDSRLQNGDVIFVPVVGPLVGISGHVKRPAIYELKGTTSLTAALKLAGGIIPTAYTQQIQVERVERNKRRIVVDVNAGNNERTKSFKLQDADLVKVFSIVGKDVNAVYLYGNVKRPGKYELKKGMRLKDIIRDESDLLEETYFDYGLIKRLSPPNYEVTLVPFDLGAVLFQGSEEENIKLAPQDSIYIFSKWFFRERPEVTIKGEVRNPGTFRLEQNLTIKDLVLMAGGTTKDASYGAFELYRTDPETKEVTLHTFNLERAVQGDASDNVELQDSDRVVIHSIRETIPQEVVTIWGDANHPGQYPYGVNMTVKDLIFAAGNLRESAYLAEAELASHVLEEGETSMIRYRTIDLRKALAGDPAENVLLKPHDTLFIKGITNWREEKYVEVIGEVKFPGRYIIRKGEHLSSLIERAGGFTDKAYLKGAIFTRESVRKLQQKNLDEAVNRLEQEILSRSAKTIETALSPEAAKQGEAAIAQRKILLAKMRSAKAKGRISIRLQPPDKLKGSPFDIALEEGDTLTIPQTPNQVQVMGAVYNQNAFVYDPKATVSSYLKRSGGLTGNADKKEMYILKVDGTAISKREHGGVLSMNWDPDRHRWVGGGFKSLRLDPGDTIVIPEKIEKVAWLRETKDITQILYQIAVTAGVLIVTF